MASNDVEEFDEDFVVESGECLFCDVTTTLEAHHVLPRSAGGSDDPENLVTLCRSCHAKVHKHFTVKQLQALLPKANRRRRTVIVSMTTELFVWLDEKRDKLKLGSVQEVIRYLLADTIRTGWKS